MHLRTAIEYKLQAQCLELRVQSIFNQVLANVMSKKTEKQSDREKQ